MKPKLFIDFDNTTVNSTKSFCSVYNDLYKNHLYYTPAKWELVNEYNFKNQCSLIDDVEEIFKMEEFFDHLDFINIDTYKTLKELSETYQLIIASIGTYENISLKSLWIKDNLPFIKDSVLIINDGVKMDKSITNMSNAVFIDDLSSNLFSSNAEFKICFGEVKQWNENWIGEHCLNWTEVKNRLL